jgi:tryptophan-rich sensory protein
MPHIPILLTTILFVIIIAVGTHVIRARIDYNDLAEHNETLGFIHSIVGMIYAILLGFCVMFVWDQYKASEAVVDAEASHISNLFMGANALDAETRTKVQAALVKYLQQVTEKEWPQMERHVFANEYAKDSYYEIWKLYTAYAPQSQGEAQWLNASIEELQALSEARRLRLLSATYGIPVFMWVIFTLFFGLRNYKSALLMASSVAVIILLVLLLIDGLNHPYEGMIKVTPDAFLLQMKHMNAIRING